MKDRPASQGPSYRGPILRTVAGFLVAFAVVAVVGRVYRPQIEALGRAFVAKFGYFGMGLGTFLADAFTLPLPSWFYFVLSVASRASAVWSIVAVTIGSLTAACLGYFMSAWFAELPWFRLRMMRVREKIAPLLEAHGLKAMVIMSLLPLPFSITCYVCGSYRIGARLFGAYVALRVPRLIVFYALAYFGFRG